MTIREHLKGIKDLRVEKTRLKDLALLDLNARFMTHEKFQRLVENLRHDGALTSVPFCWFNREKGKYEVLSGNHRVKAAIEAGIEEAHVMFTDEELSRDRRVAIQLSHNSIEGEDDPATLKALYGQIEDVDYQIYSGLDDKVLENLDDISPDSLSEAHLDFQTLNIVFLPSEVERARHAMEEIKGLVQADEQWAARFAEHDEFLDALDFASRAYGVRNMATAFAVLLNVFGNNLTDLQDGYIDFSGGPKHTGWVPMVSMFNTDAVPADAAATIVKAINLMRDKGDIETSSLWRALEMWSADYLAGND